MESPTNDNFPQTLFPSGRAGDGPLLSFIVAAAENNVMGKDNQLPWHLPADLKYFKNRTWGMPIVMGRKTFESLGKLLPGRKNIVVTRNQNWQRPGAIVVHAVPDAIAIAKADNVKELFIIGGAELFKSCMDMAHRIYLTRIYHTFEGDVYFPEINTNEWQLVKNIECKKDEKNHYDYAFQTWERIR